MSEWLDGGHAVIEALRGHRRVHEVWRRRGARIDEACARLATAAGLPLREVTGDEMAVVVAGGAAVAARCDGYRYRDEAELPAPAEASGLVVVLDSIQDPQNLGAILRTCDAVGAGAVCIPIRRAAQITPAVVRASAGASEHLDVHRVVNVARALQRLQKLGYWTVGLLPEASTVWHEVDYTGPVALVVGAEGRGVRPLVARHCDHRVRLQMAGAVGSLNAAAAFAAVAFEVARQRSLAAAAGSD